MCLKSRKHQKRRKNVIVLTNTGSGRASGFQSHIIVKSVVM